MTRNPRPSTARRRRRCRRPRRSSSTSRACTRAPGVEKPDFLAVVDAEEGRIVHETPMPNVGDELHHFGWNRCCSACHGPDRSHLIVPGFRSSRIHIVNVADDPRGPRIEKVIEPEELVAKTGYTRPHTVHCMPGDNVVVSMLGDADGNGAGGFAVLDAKTFEVKGRWENGGEKPPLNYDFWYQPRKNVLVSSEFGEPNAYEKGFDLADVEAGRYGRRIHFWNLAERKLEQTVDLGENGLDPARGALAARPRGRGGLRRRRALERDVALPPRQRRLGGRAGDRGRERRARGLAVSGARPDHRPRPLDGRPLPLLRQLAARRPPPVRRVRPRQPEADRPALARRRARQAERRRPRAARRAADAPALLRRPPPLRHQLALLDLGQPVLPGLRSWLLRVDCDPNGGIEVDRDFFVDFHDRPDGPARAHEVRLQNGDCTTEIFQ